jgi:hypothetical protein
MRRDIEAQKVFWKETQHDRVTVDKTVSSHPCFLFACSLTAGTGGAATAVIRDGHETASDPKIDLAAITSNHDNRNYNPPLFLKTGLFVDVGSNVTSVLVHFLPIKD